MRINRTFAVTAVAAAALAFGPAVPAYAERDGADLSVELTTTPFGARPGEEVTHKLTVRNDGPSSASEVTLRFNAAAGLSNPTMRTGQGSCTASSLNEIVCKLGDVKATGTDDAVSVTITGRMPDAPPPDDLVKNVAAISASESDPLPKDNMSVNAYLLFDTAQTVAMPAASPEPMENAAQNVESDTEAPAADEPIASPTVNQLLNQPPYLPIAVFVAVIVVMLGFRPATRRLAALRAGSTREPAEPHRGNGRHRVPAASTAATSAVATAVATSAVATSALSAVAMAAPSTVLTPPAPPAERSSSQVEHPTTRHTRQSTADEYPYLRHVAPSSISDEYAHPPYSPPLRSAWPTAAAVFDRMEKIESRAPEAATTFDTTEGAPSRGPEAVASEPIAAKPAPAELSHGATPLYYSTLQAALFDPKYSTVEDRGRHARP